MDNEINQLKERLSALAIQIAESFKIELDYSERSVRRVEKILSKIHKDYLKTDDPEGLQGIATEFGFYIIKTIEKNREPGQLERDHPHFGRNSFPYYWNDTIIFPCEWCLKRILEGRRENVWSKYKSLVIKSDR